MKINSFSLALVMLFLTSQVIMQCDLSTSVETRDYNVTTFASNWDFADFKVGEYYGHFYHLLSSRQDGACALVRERANGTLVYAKLYSSSPCSKIEIDSSEDNGYFASALNSGSSQEKLMLSKLDITTGNRVTHIEADINITGDVSSVSLDNSGYKLYIAGNIEASTNQAFGYWDTLGRNIYYQDYQPMSASQGVVFHAQKGLTNMCLSISSSSTSLIFVMHNLTTSTETVEWSVTYNCSSTCPTVVSGISDTDSNNIYTAISSSDSNVVYIALSLADGSVVTNFRQTDTSTTLTAGSLFVDSNSLVWIGMHATDYSELISYNTSSSTYTKYQMTGYQYMHQYVDPSNSDAWYALRSTQYSNYARISNSDSISGLTVTTGTTGFDETTSIYGSPISHTPSAFNPTSVTAAISSDSQQNFSYSMNYSCSTVSTTSNGTTGNSTSNGTNTSSDDLSAGEIVGKDRLFVSINQTS